MNIIGACITIFLVIIVLLFPRRWAALAIIAGVLYVTQGQSLLIGGINFSAIRFIELAGIIRIILKREFKISSLNNLDNAFCLFSITYLLVFLIRCIFDISSRGGITYHVGIFVDGIIVFFVFRGLICSMDDFVRFLKDTVFLLIPFAAFMVMEAITGRNIFSYMGGVPVSADIRGGFFRCQGSFRHPILAGSVGSTMIPLFLYLTLIGGNYIIGMLAILLCFVIVVASHSSGPLMAFSFGIMAWMCWPLRNNMKIVRWSILILFLSLHIFMKAPVWFIIARISEIVGGDGWHRANLIDKWINSIEQWGLIGMSWDKTQNWAATAMSWGAVDVTNQYVKIGVNGGIISLIFFIVLLVKCYKNLGRKIEQENSKGMIQNELLCWGLGASLTSHVVNLTAVTYFDQFYVIWYMLLAIISVISDTKTPSNGSNIIKETECLS